MKKNSLLLYWSPKCTSVHQQPATLARTIVGYLRCEVHSVTDLAEALDLATPRDGETVLNSVWLEE